MIKKLSTILTVVTLTTLGASAQVLLHSFDSETDFFEGGNSYANSGGAASYTDNGTTGSVVGSFTSNFLWLANSDQDWTSAANGLELTATNNSGTTSSYEIFIVDATTASLGSAVFTASALTGGPVTAAFSVTGDLTTARGFRIFTGGGSNDAMDITMDNLATVPEPSSMALIGLGAAGLYFLRRKK